MIYQVFIFVSRQFDILFCFETFVPNVKHDSEFLISVSNSLYIVL